MANLKSVTSLCLCLSLDGNASCRFPLFCETIHQTHFMITRNVAHAVLDLVATARSCHDPWKIKKVLIQTDLGSNCNVLIKRELAEEFIVPFLGGREACVNTDTNSFHALVFTLRPSNNSHVFKNTWVKDFVRRKALKIGDEIRMFWDEHYKCFVFSALRA